MGHALAGEEPLDETDCFLEAVETLAETRPEIKPERLVLALVPAPADAEDEPSVREVVERRRQLRGQPGVAEGVRGDEQSEPRRRRERRDCRQARPALELGVAPVALVGEQVVVEPDRIEPRALGREGRIPQRRPVGALDPEGRSESHLGIVER